MSQNDTPKRDELNEFVNVDQPNQELFILRHIIDDKGGFDGSSVEGAEHVLPGILKILEETNMKIKGLGLDEDDEKDLVDPVTMDIRSKPIGHPKACYLEPIVEAATKAAHHVYDAFLKHQKVLTLGGNHVRALDVLGALRACHEQGIKMGMVWVDAHPDLNTPESTASGHIHGMPSAVLQGRGPKELLDLLQDAPFIDPHDIIYVGINAIDDPKNDDGTEKEHTELKYLKALRDKGVLVHPMGKKMKKARKEGVVPDEVLADIYALNDRIKAEGGKMWTEWDVDVVDKKDMPAAVMDNTDGMSGEQIKYLFNKIGSHCDIDGVGVSEINPKKDVDEQGRKKEGLAEGEVFEGKAQKLVAEGVGHLLGVSNPDFAKHMRRARQEMAGEHAPSTATVTLPNRNRHSSVRKRVLGAIAGTAAGIGALITGTQLSKPTPDTIDSSIIDVRRMEAHHLDQFSKSDFLPMAGRLRLMVEKNNTEGTEAVLNVLANNYALEYKRAPTSEAKSLLGRVALSEFTRGFTGGTYRNEANKDLYYQRLMKKIRDLKDQDGSQNT
jgi:arginase